MMKSYLFPVSLLAVTLAIPASSSELSVAGVVSTPEVRSFLGDGHLGSPHPDAPAQLAQFGRLVGIWETETEMRAQDGTWVRTAPAVWVWKYALGGFATQDLWIHPKDHLPSYMKSLGRAYLLTSLRVFDPSGDQWRVAWAANGQGQAGGQDFGTFTASARGNDMVLTDSSAFGKQRVTFSKITKSSFEWTSEYSGEGGEWIAIMRVQARRKK